jgi:hypothetical protein
MQPPDWTGAKDSRRTSSSWAHVMWSRLFNHPRILPQGPDSIASWHHGFFSLFLFSFLFPLSSFVQEFLPVFNVSSEQLVEINILPSHHRFIFHPVSCFFLSEETSSPDPRKLVLLGSYINAQIKNKVPGKMIRFVSCDEPTTKPTNHVQNTKLPIAELRRIPARLRGFAHPAFGVSYAKSFGQP